jgi:peptidoglycan hydrolase CwlO-like protein
MKKKVVYYVCAILMCLLAIWYGVSYAQDPPPPAKQATLEELQWKAMYLQEHMRNLQADFQTTQDMLKQVQDELKARQPAPPAPEKGAKPEEKKPEAKK